MSFYSTTVSSVDTDKLFAKKFDQKMYHLRWHEKRGKL